MAITVNDGETAVTTAPTRQTEEKITVARRVPMRSTMTPPTSTMTMFGKL